MALLTSLVALSIDAMLPALPEIGRDLLAGDVNNNQLVVSVLFFGLALGLFLYGPLSDSIGRKPAVFIGMGIFIAGCLLAIFATDFRTMLLGRLLQGIGLGAPRVVAIALIRDLYEGAAMARVMSFITTLFIAVPMVAPALGQGILLVSDWRMIFWVILLLGVVSLCWFAIRQPETLPPSRRAPFSPRCLGAAAREVFANRIALGYTLAAGAIFSAFLAYLSTVQQIFQQQYALANWFPLIFAGLAFAVGSASYLNGRLVMRLGMQWIVRRSLLLLAGVSLLFLAPAHYFAGHPPLWLLLAYLAVALFCAGLLFGNINALAMEPLGHIAGMGAAVVGSLSTLMSLPVGIAIARVYAGSVMPIVAGFAVGAIVTLLLVNWAERGRPTP
ncbi:multidrug effflux MFS transporter [Exilibacterium tricleocarpae]|uniref:Multidrug effflux MFS transporter n=2 Tax=Exilibacterium tricleocarpae TaxID=2591008 RepID=A0A545TP07_9GAMM|nr:multidrug effflux MFS transporter [Exilibacterium tricleocarpae]